MSAFPHGRSGPLRARTRLLGSTTARRLVGRHGSSRRRPGSSPVTTPVVPDNGARRPSREPASRLEGPRPSASMPRSKRALHRPWRRVGEASPLGTRLPPPSIRVDGRRERLHPRKTLALRLELPSLLARVLALGAMTHAARPRGAPLARSGGSLRRRRLALRRNLDGRRRQDVRRVLHAALPDPEGHGRPSGEDAPACRASTPPSRRGEVHHLGPGRCNGWRRAYRLGVRGLARDGDALRPEGRAVSGGGRPSLERSRGHRLPLLGPRYPGDAGAHRGGPGGAWVGGHHDPYRPTRAPSRLALERRSPRWRRPPRSRIRSRPARSRPRRPQAHRGAGVRAGAIERRFRRPRSAARSS